MTDAWERAWTGGRRTANIGNVVEYNAQFGDRPPDPTWLRAGHQYADLAMFYSPDPALVVLPEHRDPCWLDPLRAALEWDPVETHTGVTDRPSLTRAVLDRPELVRRITATGGRPLGWGRTPAFDDLLVATGHGTGGTAVLDATRRWESKVAANDLFGRLTDPGIEVPAQRVYPSPRRAARAAVRDARRGADAVVKAEHGVGGAGTAVVTDGRTTRWVRRRLRGPDGAPVTGRMIVERYVAGSGPYRDLTVDGVVAEDGTAHLVGVGVMEVEITRYAGVLVGPGVVPDRLEPVAARFGLRVGAALADSGYRGWYDVDLVTTPDGTLAPTEINCRLTGPAIAFMIQARLRRVHPVPWLVRVIDRLPLGGPVPEETLYAHTLRMSRACAKLGARLVPTITSAGSDRDPTFGVALAAPDRESLSLAETLVTAATGELGDA